MHLTLWEEKAYEGEYGETMESAYRVLVATGRLLGADRLIPILSAHISGVNHANIGDAGVEFLEGFSKGAKGSCYMKSALKLGVNMLSAEDIVANYA